MKKIKLLVLTFFVAIAFWSCAEDGLGNENGDVFLSFTATPATDNPNKILLNNTSVGTENSFVYWQYSLNGASVPDKDGLEQAIYSTPGQYVITLTAVNNGKVNQVSKTITITGSIFYSCDDANAILLAGSCANAATGKTWIWSKLAKAYGVGPAPKYDSSDPVDLSWYTAPENTFTQSNGSTCVYDDKYIFKQNDTHTYTNQNNNSYQWIWSWANLELGTNNAQYADGCYGSREPVSSAWSIVYKKGTDNKDYPWLKLSNKGSIAMYEGISEYQIVELTADKMTLRNIAKDPNAAANGWRYYKLIREGFVETAPIPEPTTALKDAANFPVGMIVRSGNIGPGQTVDIIKREFDNITSEYEMKMNIMYPSNGNYDFTAADKIVKFGNDNNLNVHGHALIWHGATPDWVKNFSGTDAAFEAMVKDYITTVVTRYKGKVKSWDVVNEAVDDGNGNALRTSVFRQKMGADYIKKCFQWARDADPSCKLFYNDYNLASSSGKRTAAFAIVDVLKTAGLIDGLGEQMHIAYNGPDASSIQAVVNGTVSRNLLMHFSELDIRANPSNDLTALSTDRAIAQQNKYKEVVKIFNAIPQANKYAITVWGLRDNESWLIDFWGNIDWPLLYDSGYGIKKAHTGFLQGLE